MNILQALERIKGLNVPVITNNDVATLLHISPSYTSHLMRKLQDSGVVFRLSKGLWGITNKVDRLALPSYLCAPLPAYVSLHTALHIHGVIEQMPEIIYAVSPARTRKFKTKIATVSIHHLPVDFFFGYEVDVDPMIKIATAEKALIDYLYLQPAKSKIFTSLPEVDLSHLNLKLACAHIKKIPYVKRQVMVSRRLDVLIKIQA